MKKIAVILYFILISIPSAHAEMTCTLNMKPETVPEKYTLAQAYETGYCVVWDKEQAIKHYIPIAKQGYMPAQYKLAELYFTGYAPHFGSKETERIVPDYPKAEYWYIKAANQGHGPSQLRLAFLYAENHFAGVKTDYDLAEEWFLRAAEQDAGDARFRLGNFYQNYRKPPQYDKALHWLTLAAEGGHSAAQYDLANFYLIGKGDTLKSIDKWLYWINKSSDKNNLHAHIALSKAYRYGQNGLTKNVQKSVSFAIKAANKSKSAFWYNRVADAFFQGEGNLPQSNPRAKVWYEKSALKNNEHAKERLKQINTLLKNGVKR